MGRFRRNYKEDLFQGKIYARTFCYEQMPKVNGIEGTAKKSEFLQLFQPTSCVDARQSCPEPTGQLIGNGSKAFRPLA